MYNLTERSETIRIGDEEHQLILTTKATKEITKRYGGLEKMGDKLIKSQNMEDSLDEVIWLITLLANQEILIYNMRNKDNPKEILSEEYVELLTAPLELADYKDAIMNAMIKGTIRNVESEEKETKNVETEQIQ